MTTNVLPLSLRPALICESCWKIIRGDDGYLRVSTLDAKRRLIEPSRNLSVVRWRIIHRKCDREVIPTLSPDFLIWASQLETSNDLAQITADLMEQKWIFATNWSATVRRILADTNRYADEKRNYAGRKTRKRRSYNTNQSTVESAE
ncbi:hypothetical protein [Mycobacterium sp. Z3061]|uniref:hypothetical protein n=1 Tax=Mycobacterium sp. Z3061 TaxID=3073562 RepID=UPI002873C286|nr:hypothetical protein [Mycobacterium sp. Z3061]